MTNKITKMLIARVIKLERQVQELMEMEGPTPATGAEDRRVPARAGGFAPDRGGRAILGAGGPGSGHTPDTTDTTISASLAAAESFDSFTLPE